MKKLLLLLFFPLLFLNLSNTYAQPHAEFLMSSGSGCINDGITFINLSFGGVVSYHWDFGDGNTSISVNPTHIYSNLGTYTIKLTATDSAGLTSTWTEEYTVHSPKADFVLTPEDGCATPHTVFFTDQSTLPDTWLWDFGDGNTSTLQNPVHNYTSTGEFDVKLTVTDTIYGCSDVMMRKVRLNIPTANFTANTTFGCGPLTTIFTDTSTNSGPDSITGWNWNFGDGNTSTEQHPTHTYQDPGVYTVSLTTTLENGCTNTNTKQFFVQVIGPNVNFGAADDDGRITRADLKKRCLPLTVNFTDSTIFGAPITSWTWDFGDGNTSNLQNPTHTYTTPNQYDVSLRVTDIDGCERTVTFDDYIKVQDGSVDIVYVDANATGGANDGTSWTNAFTDLESALDLQDCGFDGEIRVAGGTTYKPSASRLCASGDCTTSRDNYFLVNNNIKLKGSYVPDSDTDPTNDIQDYSNPTILSGDIGAPNSNLDNVHHVLVITNVDNTMQMDGFVISGGNANGSGNQIIGSDSISKEFGGGIYGFKANAIVTNIMFTGNSSITGGGGISNTDSSPTLSNVVFYKNGSKDGGGMFNSQFSSATITNAVFYENIAAEKGGAMFNGLFSSPTITNVTISKNVAVNGGGFFNTFFAAPKIYNTVLYSNGSDVENSNASVSGTNNFSENYTNSGFTELINSPFIDETNPLGVDGIIGTLDDGLLPKKLSVLIDSGDNGKNLLPIDIAGSTRIRANTIDVGAYEVQCDEFIANVNPITVQLNDSGNYTLTQVNKDAIINGSSASDISFNFSQEIFECSDMPTKDITVTIADTCTGNSEDKTVTITIEDNTPPQLLGQGNGLPSITAQCEVTSIDPPMPAMDNCAGTVTATTTTTFPITGNGTTTTVVWTYDDGNGNSITQTQQVNIQDTMPPVVAIQDITVQLDTSGNATITPADVDDNSTDNCGIQSMTLDKTAFTCANIGANTVTLTVTDINGLVSTETAKITVEDTTPPNVVAQDITVQLDVSGSVSITPAQINNGSSDACGIQSMTLNITDFTCANVGANTVTLTVTDNNGQSDNANATVTVQDTTPPNAVTQDITVQLDDAGNVSITPAQIDNGSSDACGIQSMTLNTTDFTCVNVGANTVTLTVTDNNGQSANANAIVTVQDTTAPNVVTQNITVQLDATGNVSITPAQINNGSSDACGIQSMTLNATDFTCANVGVNTVTLTVTDNNGQSANANATVTVEDTMPPNVITQDITVQLDATGNVSITPAQIDNGSSDACGIQSMSLNTTDFTCANIGANTVTLTLTDNNGQSANANATVTVEDTMPPNVITQDITVQLDATGNVSITPVQIDNGSSDACGIQSMSLNTTDFTCANIGANTVALTVTDNNGQSTNANATVTVEDVTAPIAIAKDIVVELDANGNATITPEEINDDSYDACGIQSLSLDKTMFNCPTLTAHLVVLTVTDVNGLSSTAEAEVTFVASDIDNDLIADICDDDMDGDGVLNVNDNCVRTPNSDQADLDRNGVGDVCDNGGLVIPKGFSPNGDNINDEFIIKGLHKYPNNSIEILNRWGARVYRSADYQNYWDGVGDDRSKKLPAGPYFYILSIDGGKRVLKGWIYINY